MLRRLLLCVLLVSAFPLEMRASDCSISYDRQASDVGGPNASGDYFIDMAVISGSNSGCPNGGNATFSITWILQKQFTQTVYPYHTYWTTVETYCTDYTDTCCQHVVVESAYVDAATCKTLHGAGFYQQIAQANSETCATLTGNWLGVLSNTFTIN